MLLSQFQMYSCSRCGGLVEVLHAGGGRLNCCGQAMLPAPRPGEPRADLPAAEAAPEGQVSLTVVSTDRPPRSGRFVEWIELANASRSFRLCVRAEKGPKSPSTTRPTPRYFGSRRQLWKGNVP